MNQNPEISIQIQKEFKNYIDRKKDYDVTTDE